MESRAHALEDDLKWLKEKPSLSGNDFLPLVIKLDELLTHLQSVSELVARLSRLHSTQHDVVHTITAVLQDEKQKLQGAKTDAGVEATLQQLTAHVARENNKEATLQCTGLEAVPEDSRRAIKYIGLQPVTTAIVHFM